MQEIRKAYLSEILLQLFSLPFIIIKYFIIGFFLGDILNSPRKAMKNPATRLFLIGGGYMLIRKWMGVYNRKKR